MDYKDFNDYELLYLVKEKSIDEDFIFKKYKPLIEKIAYKYFPLVRNKGIDIDDLIQEGYIALDNALKGYNDKTGNLFYTFSSICIERKIGGYVKRLLTAKKDRFIDVYSLDNDTNNQHFLEIIDSKVRNPLGDIIYNDCLDKTKSFIYSLPDIQSQILELRLSGFTYKDISKILDIKKSKIDSAIIQIKKNFKYQQLKRYISKC